MSAPTIAAIFPNDGSSGIPIGTTIQITFDQGIDESTILRSLVLFGPENDKTSGPDNAVWLKSTEYDESLFASTPGLTGKVLFDYDLFYVDSSGNEVSHLPIESSLETERHKVVLRPKSPLGSGVKYFVYLIGDSEDGTSSGISHRTVFETDTTLVTSTTGTVNFYGGYTGEFDDAIWVEILNDGNIGVAKYRWWLDSSPGPSSGVSGEISSRRYRFLEEEMGVQIRFSGSGFVTGDIYKVNLRAPVPMEDSYSFSFTTGEGTIMSVPDTASTSIIGTETSLISDASRLEVLEMDPPDGATHQRWRSKKITITFSSELDSETITDESVKIYAYPVSGDFDSNLSNTQESLELAKKLSVEENKLIIEV